MKALKAVCLVLFVFCGIAMSSEKRMNSLEAEDVMSSIQDSVLIGKLEVKDIESFDWYAENYSAYKPNSKVLSKLKAVMVHEENVEIEIYFGTWCPDSQFEVPRLIKLLDVINFDKKKISLIGVDRDKVVPNISKDQAESLSIEMVPTFIFLEDHTEFNRFVELPRKTLEKDILSILSKENYEHSYK